VKVSLIAATPGEHASGAPASTSRDFAFESYNYAIGLLAACVREDPVASRSTRVTLHDLPISRSQTILPAHQLERVLADDPDVIGLSCYCWSADLLLDSAAELRRRRPGVRIIAGGPSASFSPQALLEKHEALDIVVRGEGEAPFVALCRAGFDRPWEIPNVTARNGTAILHNDREDEADLAALPSAYLSGALAPPSTSLLVEPSRGCRFRCRFCSWSTRRGSLRYADDRRLEAEIRWGIEHGCTSLNFCDSAVNHDTDALRRLCAVVARADPERALSLSLFVRHEQLDDEQLALLSGLRCDELIIGLESIHEEALRSCGKAPLDRDRFERRLEALGAMGHRATLSIMSGLPGDTVQGFGATLDYLEELMQRRSDTINSVCCFWLAILPGTRFAVDCAAQGFEVAPRGTPYLLRSLRHTPSDLQRMAADIVERTRRNPRFRCEEIHRDAVAPQRRARPGPAPATHAPSTAIDPSALIAPWRPGEVHGEWTLRDVVPVPPSEGWLAFRFAHRGGEEVLVVIAPRRQDRVHVARTGRFDLYYRCDGAGAVPGTQVERLTRALAAVIARNERNLP